MAAYGTGIYGTGVYGTGEAGEVPTTVVSLTDVKRHLNIPTSHTADDAELLMHLDAATSLVEEYVGPVLPRTLTTTAVWGTTLLSEPVSSVTSVLSGGIAVDYTLNADAGLLVAPAGAAVTYVAGFSTIPGAIKLAVLETVKDSWTSQRGARPAPAGGPLGDDGSFLPRGTDELPPSVLRYLRPYRRTAAIA